ncbi:MAG: FkbM family methyltransferase, partial [Candidatus Freyarchaeota archaeon]
ARRVRVDLRPIGINKVLYLYTPLDDVGLSMEIAVFGVREPLHVKWLYRVVERLKPRILDIGSNIGYFPMIELEAGASHVIAVEPIPISFKCLQLNLRRYHDRTTLVNAAVVEDDRDSVEMYVPRELGGFRLNNARVSDGGDLVVKARNINDLVEQFRPHMIRMDIEGYEWRLLGVLNDSSCILAIDLETHSIPETKRVIGALENLYKLGFKKALVLQGICLVQHIIQMAMSLLGVEKALTLFDLRYLRHKALLHLGNVEELLKHPNDVLGKHVIFFRNIGG